MRFRRLLFGLGLLCLTGSVPLGLGACVPLRTAGVCCRTCSPEQKACGNGCIRHDEPCRAATGCACDSRNDAMPARSTDHAPATFSARLEPTNAKE
jgi:hypothetical protein